jgi:Glycosyl-4,4'-diaponeurosporenoate acyltransferase
MTALAWFLVLWNVLFNLYPIALQRHNRARLRQAAARRARLIDGRRPLRRLRPFM